MIMGITISNSQVYFLGFSLWKYSLQYVGNGGIYIVGKDLVKQTWQISQTECFTSISQESLTRETLAKTPGWHDFSPSSHVLYTWLISWDSFSCASREIHLFILLSLNLHTLLHLSLTIKNHLNIEKYDWIKLQSNLAWN